jgi:predicted nucleotidyltransferase
MPVRSLRSSILKWPDAALVASEAKRWAEKIAAQHPELVRAGYFGSYARGNWGVGSDLDLVLIVERAEQPFPLRSAAFETAALPVPADVLVYTEAEWEALGRRGGFGAALHREVIWVYERERAGGGETDIR